MQKLTLSVDRAVVDGAKRYARDTFQRDDAGLSQEPAVRETTEAFLPLD